MMTILFAILSLLNIACFNADAKTAKAVETKEEFSQVSEPTTENVGLKIDGEDLNSTPTSGIPPKRNEEVQSSSSSIDTEESETQEHVEEAVKEEDAEAEKEIEEIAEVREDQGLVQEEGETEEIESKEEELEEVEAEVEVEEVNIEEALSEVADELPVVTKPDHSAFNSLLTAYVSASGLVNYTGLKKDEAKLDAYIKNLSDNPVASGWSKNEQLAYWINAYNAATIKLILKNFPVKKIIDLDGGKPWDVKWIKLGGKTYSLNQIEHEIIRPQFKDARIHFAVNCAAKSCPPLANKAYTAGNVQSLLESQTKAFLNNSKYNSISANELKLSKIFDWYKEDFGNVATYVKKYKSEVSGDASVSFFEYDWALNGK